MEGADLGVRRPTARLRRYGLAPNTAGRATSAVMAKGSVVRYQMPPKGTSKLEQSRCQPLRRQESFLGPFRGTQNIGSGASVGVVDAVAAGLPDLAQAHAG